MSLLLSYAGAAAAAVVAFILGLVLWFVHEITKEPPRGGTQRKLPNQMVVQQWKAAETDFLYKEIFGDENAYAKGGILFREGATIVDCGANIGMFSLFAAQQCRGNARIISFEPIPQTFSVLSKNAASANAGQYDEVFKPRPGAALEIKPLNVGVSDKPAEVVFEHHPHFTVWSTSDPVFAAQRLQRIQADTVRACKSSPNVLVRALPSSFIDCLGGLILRRLGRTEKVPAKLVPLSDIIAREGLTTIDLLKVDVEGAELLVLQGVKDVHWPLIQQVAMEVENFETVRRISALLESKGFKVSHFASERERDPGVHSEVSMLYGIRPAYAKKQ